MTVMSNLDELNKMNESDPTAIFLSIFLALIFIFGSLANILVISVTSFHRHTLPDMIFRIKILIKKKLNF